jgi:hypothetical protein
MNKRSKAETERRNGMGKKTVVLAELEKKFPRVELGGKEYWVCEDAYYDNYRDTIAYYAHAYDAQGDEYLVRWDITAEYAKLREDMDRAGLYEDTDQSSACDWDSPAEVSLVRESAVAIGASIIDEPRGIDSLHIPMHGSPIVSAVFVASREANEPEQIATLLLLRGDGDDAHAYIRFSGSMFPGYERGDVRRGSGYTPDTVGINAEDRQIRACYRALRAAGIEIPEPEYTDDGEGFSMYLEAVKQACHALGESGEIAAIITRHADHPGEWIRVNLG